MLRAVTLFAALLLTAIAAPAQTQAQAQTKVRIGKPQAGAFQFVPVDIGIEVGIFKKHGLDVEASAFGGGPRVQQALAAGALDFAIGSGPELAMVVKGAPEIGVAALADAPYAVVLAVLNDGPKTIADLKGKKISVSSRGGLTYWLAQELSRRQGWGTDGFVITPLGATTAQTAALRTKQIDGMIVEVNAGYRLEEERPAACWCSSATCSRRSTSTSSTPTRCSRPRTRTRYARSWPAGSRPSSGCRRTASAPSRWCAARPTCRSRSPPATMTS
jgi:ABC-type nitrate/sulfonate/bicarbonate transport system substrate-binding protein